MPKNPIRSKIIPSYQDYRQKIGNHVNWQDKRIGNQQYQDTRVKRLANYPGLNSENVGRQNATHAMVQLLSILNSVQISSSDTKEKPKNSDLRFSSHQNYQKAIDNLTSFKSNEFEQAPIQPALNSSDINNRHLYINKYVSELRSNNLRSAVPAISSPSSCNDQGCSKNSSRLKKRYVSSTETIINEISNIIHDNRLNARLRFRLESIFNLSKKSPDVKHALEEDKDLFILMKCIQQMHFFLKQNKDSQGGKELFTALIKIAEDLNNPYQKQMINQFKEVYISESHISRVLNASNSTMLGSNHKMRLVKDPISLKLNDDSDIFKKQTISLYSFLEKHGFIADQDKSLTIVNNLVLYILSGKDYEKRITRVARHLLRSMGLYRSGKEQHISDERKMAVIAGYLNYAILGMPLETWVAKNIKNVKLYHHFWFNNIHLKLLFDNLLNFSSDKGELSHEARQFYRKNVLNKLLPILTLQLSAEDSKELNSIDITQPRWGFIHAGAKILNDTSAGLVGLMLAEIEDVGMTFYIMLHQGMMPEEYFVYFRLPALIYYARNVYGANLSMLTDQKMQDAFQGYFDYIHKWEEENNPLDQLSKLLDGWKTRTDLAKTILHQHNISDEWVTSYLNSHNKVEYNIIQDDSSFLLSKLYLNSKHQKKKYFLPNVDEVFKEKNIEISNMVYKIDKIILPWVFNSLSEDEQRFIEQSKVDRVRVEFNARDSIYGVPLPPSSQMGLVQSDAFIYRIPNYIDLLACTCKSEERIYALENSKYNEKYTIQRVDRDREALLDLLDDNSIPRRDKDYKLRVTSHFTLKEQAETPQKLIENLAKVHKKKLLIELEDQGYDKTTQEKVGDFLMGLIPFYTCITEGLEGNKQEAIPACIFDTIGIIPFIGKVTQTGMRFGLAAGGVTSVAIRYGIKQATVKMMLKEMGRKMIRHSPFIAKKISPQVIQSLNYEFLGFLDPGFGLIIDTLKVNSVLMKTAFEVLIDKTPQVSRGLRLVYFNFIKKIIENPKIKPKLKKIKNSKLQYPISKFIKGAKLIPEEVITSGLDKLMQQKSFKANMKGKTTWVNKKEEGPEMNTTDYKKI